VSPNPLQQRARLALLDKGMQDDARQRLDPGSGALGSGWSEQSLPEPANAASRLSSSAPIVPRGSKKRLAGLAVAIIGAAAEPAIALLEASGFVGLESTKIRTIQQAAAAAQASTQFSLALADSSGLVWSCPDLLPAMRRNGLRRAVLVGPRFGSSEHLMALELGFDEVWESGVTAEVLVALLRNLLRFGQRHSGSQGGSGTALGALAVRSQDGTCIHQGRPLKIGSSLNDALALLVASAPGAVSRQDLAKTIPKTRVGRSNGSRVVDVHISRLRRELIHRGLVDFDIQAARGYGYRIVNTSPVA
jgi:two-component system, OmpR family, response regulator